MSRFFPRALGALMVLACVVQARAADLDQYDKLVSETVRELASGTLADPQATQQRLKAAMAIGIEACREWAKESPADAKLMQLVLASAPAMTAMTPAKLEEEWGDDGTAGDAAGISLSGIDQFSKARNHLDLVVHPARAHGFIEMFVQTEDRQALAQAKGELIEVVEHVSLILKR